MGRTVTMRVSRELAEYLRECQRHEMLVSRNSRIKIPEVSKSLALNLRFTLPPESFYMKKRGKNG